MFAKADDYNPDTMQNTATTPETRSQTFTTISHPTVRIAYFIMVHHQPEAFISMFPKIYTRDQFYLVHIDRKSAEDVTEKIQLFLTQFPNVHILESMNIISGGFSMIRAELNAMEYLLNASREWDYFINLSGEDYPLKSQYVIRKFLAENKGRNYLFYYDQKFYRPDTLRRIQNHFTELRYKISSLIYKRDFMIGVTPYIGGKWLILTRDTCSFLTTNKRVLDFEDYYLHTFLPSDSFFQTVLMNTDFKDIIVNDDKRAVIESTFIKKYKSYLLLIEDLKASNHLFIRKINKSTDQIILKYISDTYNTPLPEINEIERELKRDNDHKRWS